MKGLKDCFCRVIAAFLCFVINLLPGKKNKKSDKITVVDVNHSCGNSGNPSKILNENVENKINKNKVSAERMVLSVYRGAYKIRVPCTHGP